MNDCTPALNCNHRENILLILLKTLPNKLPNISSVKLGIDMLRKFNFEGFLKAIEDGKVLPDFDARTGHNHGTKFRMRQNCLPMLYEEATIII